MCFIATAAVIHPDILHNFVTISKQSFSNPCEQLPGVSFMKDIPHSLNRVSASPFVATGQILFQLLICQFSFNCITLYKPIVIRRIILVQNSANGSFPP